MQTKQKLSHTKSYPFRQHAAKSVACYESCPCKQLKTELATILMQDLPGFETERVLFQSWTNDEFCVASEGAKWNWRPHFRKKSGTYFAGQLSGSGGAEQLSGGGGAEQLSGSAAQLSGTGNAEQVLGSRGAEQLEQVSGSGGAAR